ncbi:MAG: TraB/GumN family protein [Candidatus Aenigmatarchaeota archaeon]|nr:TraB/GumN family protein [Candidatus Aenigmarchaeota archaeon]
MPRAKIIIIGTSHISPQSVEATRDRILREQPDCVAIELDPIRYRALQHPQPPSIRAGATAWLLHTLQNRLSKATGVLPGSEMLAAINTAKEIGADIVLIDMSIERILAEMRAVPMMRKFSMLLHLLVSATFGQKTVNLSDVPDERLVRQVLRYMSKKMPDFYKILVTERNAYMAKWVRELAKKHKKIVVVVGMAHVAGLSKLLKVRAK